jgi:hypothetical protein
MQIAIALKVSSIWVWSIKRMARSLQE